MRASGVELRAQLISGLRARGCDVIDVGRVSTPMLYHATTALGGMGGVMITASHNPGEYNGFKVCREQAIPVGIETGLREIRDAALEVQGSGPEPAAGDLRETSVRESYARRLLELFPARPRLRVAIDCGNGIASVALELLLEQLSLDVLPLYFEPDGSFPNHEADPLKLENLEDLRRCVRERDAQLGIAFDGDGDRAVFVDERGEVLPADLTTALFAQALFADGALGTRAGASVVYDLRSSRVVPELIEKLGGVPVRTRVGHAFVKQRMRECGAPFGGELSGHYYFRFPPSADDEGYVADDGAAAMLLMLQVLERAGRPLSELWQPLRRYARSGEVNRRVSDVAAVLRLMRETYADAEQDELDGLTVQYPDWWFNLRPSNTEPLLRLNVEAPSEAEMSSRRDQILALIGA
jgi:phosphomannomutase